MKKYFSVILILTALLILTSCPTDPPGNTDTTPADTTAPAIAELTVTEVGFEKISLSWSEPADADYDHLHISWEPGGTTGIDIAKGTTSYQITGLTNGEEYTVSGRTVDTAGNLSDAATVTLTVPADEMEVRYISTAAELAAIDDTPEGLNDYYILANDIDLAGIEWVPLCAEVSHFLPPDVSFTGVINGDGHSIKNLHFDISSGYEAMGLLTCLGTGGILENIILETVDIKGRGYVGALVGYSYEGTVRNCSGSGQLYIPQTGRVGGLVGVNDSGSLIDNCQCSASVENDDTHSETGSAGGLCSVNNGTINNSAASGDVSNQYYAGGLTGAGYGIINNCHAEGEVSGHNYIGGLAGNYQNSIKNCSATGNVTGNQYTGGLIGEADIGSTIENSHATGTVNASGGYAGGLIGEAYGTVTSCHATGDVTGLGYTGGLIGKKTNDYPLTLCYATGNVSSNSYAVGGLIGQSDGPISLCYASGNVTSHAMAGGLIGISDGTISNCYATGSVTGTWILGGLIGGNTVTVEKSYSTGLITDTGGTDGGIGALAAGDIPAVNSFYDRETSGYDAEGGDSSGWAAAGTPKTTAEMQTEATFTGAGWDFEGETGNGTDDYWDIDAGINGGYPYLTVF